jgi:hemolysin activation/secretion protein
MAGGNRIFALRVFSRVGIAAAMLIPALVLGIEPIPVRPEVGRPLGTPLPADERPTLPDFERPEEDSRFEFLQRTPAPGAIPIPEDLLEIPVRSIRVRKNTVLSEDKIREGVAPYEKKKELTTWDLQQLRYELTLLYVKAGYVTSGVILSDPNPSADEIFYDAVEGTLSRIPVSGSKRLEDYIQSRVKLAAEPAVNTEELRDRLEVLSQSPLIKSINGHLKPDTELGKSILEVSVEENQPYRLSFNINNYRSPSIGSIQGALHAAHLNLTRRGDTLGLIYSKTSGLDDLYLSANIPVTPHDTAVSLGYRRSDSKVVEEPFNELDVESEFRSGWIGVIYPVILKPRRRITAGLIVENRRSKTFLLGRPFSFSPGVQDGKGVVTVARLSGEFDRRSVAQALAARSLISIGFDAFGATTNDDAPDSRFVAWLGQLQWARRFGKTGYEALFRVDVQLTPDELLPMEKFPVGGPLSVRGYRTNQLVRDNGLASSIEFRVPVFQREVKPLNLKLAAFADYGRSWNAKRDTPEPRSLSSVGVGLLWSPIPELHTQLYWAWPFENIANPHQGLQDEGITFNVSYNMF